MQHLDSPKHHSPKRLPDINVPPAEPSRGDTPRSGAADDGRTVQQLLTHMRDQRWSGIKKEFESLEKYDRKASYSVFK